MSVVIPVKTRSPRVMATPTKELLCTGPPLHWAYALGLWTRPMHWAYRSRATRDTELPGPFTPQAEAWPRPPALVAQIFAWISTPAHRRRRFSQSSCQTSCCGSAARIRQPKHSTSPRTTAPHLVNRRSTQRWALHSAEVKHAFLRPRSPTVAASATKPRC